MNPITCREVCTSLVPIINSPNNVVDKIATVSGPVDVYCWFEGPFGVPKAGGEIMKRDIIQPILDRNKDATLCLYSLRSWKFEDVFKIDGAVPRITNEAIEWVRSADFFQYCANPSREIAGWVNIKLCEKKWLNELSKSKNKRNKKVQELFKMQNSLFDCIKEKDVNRAYSFMQYIEGYYLVQRSIKKGLDRGQKKIEIVFALPNDEGKYYKDFPDDIDDMLKADFKEDLNGIEVNIAFQFFEYTQNIDARPYLGNGKKYKISQIPGLFS